MGHVQCTLCNFKCFFYECTESNSQISPQALNTERHYRWKWFPILQKSSRTAIWSIGGIFEYTADQIGEASKANPGHVFRASSAFPNGSQAVIGHATYATLPCIRHDTALYIAHHTWQPFAVRKLRHILQIPHIPYNLLQTRVKGSICFGRPVHNEASLQGIAWASIVSSTTIEDYACKRYIQYFMGYEDYAC